MIEKVKNEFSVADIGEEKGSFADFYVFQRRD
jgi:hypothetical protein